MFEKFEQAWAAYDKAKTDDERAAVLAAHPGEIEMDRGGFVKFTKAVAAAGCFDDVEWFLESHDFDVASDELLTIWGIKVGRDGLSL